MMTAEEMKKEFYELCDMMAMSHDVENMRTFGNVHKEMMGWMVQNKPDLAQEWIGKLESIRWCNCLTPKEAEKIVSEMVPRALLPCARLFCLQMRLFGGLISQKVRHQSLSLQKRNQIKT